MRARLGRRRPGSRAWRVHRPHRAKRDVPSMAAEQEALVEEHHEFARRVARRVVSETAIPIEIDDAVGCALVGLVDAARRFDPERLDGDRFASFAYPRIRGEIIDHVRRNSLVSRSDLAQGERARVFSLDTVGVARERGEEGSAADVEVEVPAPSGDREMYIDLRDAMSGLSDRESYVVMAFATGASGVEVAEELGISETRVWTIANLARAKLERDMAA